LNVFVQGNIAGITLTTPVFMAVHDLGTNRKIFFALKIKKDKIPENESIKTIMSFIILSSNA
jgi:hypothetical protein